MVDMANPENPTPQARALESPADELFYGGSAGGGKSDLLIGAALTRHKRSIIFRRYWAAVGVITARIAAGVWLTGECWSLAPASISATRRPIRAGRMI
jgi:hypothetical protein